MKRFLSVLTILMMAGMFAILASPSSVKAVVTGRTYTVDADFDEGTLVGVEHETVHDQLQLSKESVTLPFIWVPNSNEGTVSKYDTVTGKELGRYRTGPTSNGSPSRTTVDQKGNVWFGNRGTGTVVKIGLYEAGEWDDRNGDTICQTSRDINNDGMITGAEVLPWWVDECVLFEVYVGGGPRGIAIDANGDLWAGTFNLSGGNKFFHIDGDTGSIIVADTINLYSTTYSYASYGALVDAHGYLWSSSLSNYVLKIDPATKSITKVNLTFSSYPYSITSYGIGIDNNDHLFVAAWGQGLMAKIDVNTAIVLKYAGQGDSHTRGVAVTSDGDVWAVNSQNGDVTRLDNNLTWKATISIGAGDWGATSTGAAVDAAGKVWACNYHDGFIHRIDPATDSIDLSVQTPGIDGTGVGMHYSYSDMTGIIARNITTKMGTWTVCFDSDATDMPWGKISWSSYEPDVTSVTVRVRSSNDKSSWSLWETATNAVSLSSTPVGRYLEIETTLKITSGDESPILYDLTVEVGNLPPVADAGPDQIDVEQTDLAGTEVTLDGSGSTDDGLIEPLTYDWTWDGGSATGVNPMVSLPLGTTTITLTVFDGQFSDTDDVDITVVDTTPPEVGCVKSVNPHGNIIPGKNRGNNGNPKPINPDGFYKLLAEDICDVAPEIYVGYYDTDSVLQFVDGAGPYLSNTTVKLTEAPGAMPSVKPIGSTHSPNDKGQADAVAAHITVPSEPVIIAVDVSGNVGYCLDCIVPPPPH